MGWSSAPIQKIIGSLGTNMPWSKFKDELRRCISHHKSRAHTSNELECLRQECNENLCVFILKYTKLHKSVTGKKPADETDPTYIMKFLRKMNNKAISCKVTLKRIPDGTTLLEIFNRVIELKAGFQLSEELSLNSPTEIMETLVKSTAINGVTTSRRNPREYVCWRCGEMGHLQ